MRNDSKPDLRRDNCRGRCESCGMIRWLMLGALLLLSCECRSSSRKEAESSRETPVADAAAAVPLSAEALGLSETKLRASDSSTDHEDVYRLTCYTCVNVSDNKMCNEWAIDVACPAGGRDFCRSLHILDSRGQSVLVNKSCASRAECSPASVGCMPIDTQKICISCCDTSYCNEESPSNSSNAGYSRTRPWPPVSSITNSEGEGEQQQPSAAGRNNLVVEAAILAVLLQLQRY